MSQIGRNLRGVPLGVALLILLLPQLSLGLDPEVAASPRPSLSPADMVRMQIEALGENDARDSGISLAFRFASPANKGQTGPLSNFTRMLKRDPYRLMLKYDKVVYGEIEVAQNAARQQVILIGDSEIRTFVFLLSKQASGRWKDCWMTDAVLVGPAEAQTI